MWQPFAQTRSCKVKTKTLWTGREVSLAAPSKEFFLGRSRPRVKRI
jgi:hypothetical protein